MDFRLGGKSDELASEARTFLAAHLDSDTLDSVHDAGDGYAPDFLQAQRERGWLAPGWPEHLGGQGLDPIEVMALHDEFQRAGAPILASSITILVANMIRLVGTDSQRREILPRAVGGEIMMALGFSEPEAGSDLAAVRTRASRDGDDWIVNGQKMFTTNAHLADYSLVLARTDPESARHAGLTVLLVPLRQAGVEIQAVYTISGERTNIVFYSDARVPDTWRLGPVDDGWRIITECLKLEHAASYAGESSRYLHHAEAWARQPAADTGNPPFDRADVRARLGRAATEIEVARLLQRRAVWMQADGRLPAAEGPMAKLFSSEAITRQANDFIDMLGPDGIRRYRESTAPVDGQIEFMLRFAVGTTLYNGTSEIQRSIIARTLGLPRSK
jgi:alkylation response protein AidB-like acyl-CoA dehydrogenase